MFCLLANIYRTFEGMVTTYQSRRRNIQEDIYSQISKSSTSCSMCKASDLYSGAAWFKSRQWHRLYLYFRGFLPSLHTKPETLSKLGHDSFRQNPFQFIFSDDWAIRRCIVWDTNRVTKQTIHKWKRNMSHFLSLSTVNATCTHVAYGLTVAPLLRRKMQLWPLWMTWFSWYFFSLKKHCIIIQQNGTTTMNNWKS